MDTIFAVSSGMPPAAIAVLRISGPRAFDAGAALAGTLPSPRRAGLCELRDPASGDVLDHALVLCFPAPATATGEGLVELHLHGGRAVTTAVARVLGNMSGLREAEPGEFTRRALANGRIDLTEAEGLGDLLMAETEAQRRLALRSVEGGLRRRVDTWESELLALSAAVEALLDHGDEADVADQAAPFERLRSGARALASEVEVLLDCPPVERVRDGIRVVIAGPPNAGKSSLFNAMTQRDAAIVSPIAGTTRDRIEAPVSRGGIAYVLIDTAGLHSGTGDAIEAIGMARAQAALSEADILLWLGDEAAPETVARVIGVHARCDVVGREGVPGGRVGVSALTGAGLEAVWEALAREALELLPGTDALALNRRQHRLCADAAAALGDAACESDELLFAEHLRLARQAFDRITGKAEVEDVLDALFGRFCIGK